MQIAKQKDWLLFEIEVRELVEHFGYQAEHTQPSHDYGVDVIGTRGSRRVVIQCKLYKTSRVGGETINQLAGSRQFHDATDAICITTGRYTKQAREIAGKLNINLLDRDAFRQLCRERSLTPPTLTALVPKCKTTLPPVLLAQPLITIGRDENCHISLQDDLISRHHARLERSGLILRIADCGSKNGTFVNGIRIFEPTALNYGDEIDLGRFRFVCELSVSQT